MSILTRCAQCNKLWQTGEEAAGLTGTCPACGQPLKVPERELAADRPAASAPELPAPLITPPPVCGAARPGLPPVLRMPLMTPPAGGAAFLAAALTLLVGGVLTQGLIWITGGITAVTGRIFVFQILLVIAILVLIPGTLLCAWIGSGGFVSQIVLGTVTDPKSGRRPLGSQRTLAALLCPPVAFVAYYTADTLVWSLVTAFFLAGTVPQGPSEIRLAELRQEHMTVERQQRRGIVPDPVHSATRLHEEQRLTNALRQRRQAEVEFAPYAFNHRWLLWVGCVAATMTALVVALNPSALTPESAPS